MNRTLLFSIAVFVAVVSFAMLVGKTNQAKAGHGSHGTYGHYGCYGGVSCHGVSRCHGISRCYGAQETPDQKKKSDGKAKKNDVKKPEAKAGDSKAKKKDAKKPKAKDVNSKAKKKDDKKSKAKTGDSEAKKKASASAPIRSGSSLAYPIEQSVVGNTTLLVLHVPEDAKVYLTGNKTRSKGAVRKYATTKLPAGAALTNYAVRVEVQRNGKTVVKERKITLRAGRTHELTIDVTPVAVASR